LFCREVVKPSIPRSKVMNDRICASSMCCSSFAAYNLLFQTIERFVTRGYYLARGWPSIRSAIASNMSAEQSSYSCWDDCTAAGNSKPCNWRRYLWDAIRITKSVGSCGRHCRMWSRKRRSCPALLQTGRAIATTRQTHASSRHQPGNFRGGQVPATSSINQAKYIPRDLFPLQATFEF
jgi:hypothetical protein